MIEQMSSRDIYQNRWMKLREDQVRFPDGSTGIYSVVEKVDFVIVIPRHADGRFELVEQYRYPVGARFWEFPMGAWETKPEAPLIEVAHGELGEETGLKAENMTLLTEGLHEAAGHSTQRFSVYLASGLSKSAIDHSPDHEEQDLKTGTFTLAEIKFVGPSGCGKSTLLRLIAGLDDPTSGDIMLAGNRVNATPASERGLSMVFQSYALYPHMSVAKNLSFGLENLRMTRAVARASYRGGNGNGSRLDAPLCVSRSFSYSMSRFPIWMQNCACKCGSKFPTSTLNSKTR